MAPEGGDRRWLWLGYVTIAILLLANLAYILSGRIELSEDEAYQWLWSKHLALSYWSKPPLIAYLQFLGTTLWGDREFGVRFFAPVGAALVALLVLRFVAREADARTAFWLMPIMEATPLLPVGAVLLTIDTPSVLFWTAAMVSGWRAVRRDSTRHWLWTGLWMGLGFLAKYIGLFQWVCWAAFFLLWAPARGQLRRPGPYLALAVNLVCTVPVLIWNYQHGWIALSALANRGGLDAPWRPTLGHLGVFLGAEVGLLNPVFFVAIVWAAWAIWRRRPRRELEVYLFSMGAPLFLFYTLYTLRAKVLENWIAPAVVPLLCLMAVYWADRWRLGARAVARWLATGLVIGLTVTVLLHETDLVATLTGHPLPPRLDPLRRVRSWRQTARVVEEARVALEREGRPTFVIGNHYGITSLLAFYLPRGAAGAGGRPIAYVLSSDSPQNQFYFWPGYAERRGENAIYVERAGEPGPPPERLVRECDSVTSLGTRTVEYRGQPLRLLRLFACRGLK